MGGHVRGAVVPRELDLEGNRLLIPRIRNQEINAGIPGWNPQVHTREVSLYEISDNKLSSTNREQWLHSAAILSRPWQFRQFPNVVRDSRFHGGRDAHFSHYLSRRWITGGYCLTLYWSSKSGRTFDSGGCQPPRRMPSCPAERQAANGVGDSPRPWRARTSAAGGLTIRRRL